MHQPHIHVCAHETAATGDSQLATTALPYATHLRRVAARLPRARHDATLTPCQCHTKPYPYMESAHMEHTSDRPLIHALRLKTNARKGSPPQPRVASRLSGQHAGAEPEPGTRQGQARGLGSAGTTHAARSCEPETLPFGSRSVAQGPRGGAFRWPP